MKKVLNDDYKNLFRILNLIVLSVTLLVLIIYACDTRRIANQTQESNLRPVILRSGGIPGLEHLKPVSTGDTAQQTNPPNYLEFTISKNIATDINGYIITEGYKYQLIFGAEMPKVIKNVTEFKVAVGWMPPGSHLFAVFKEDGRRKINEENRIYLSYKDIEGNSYHTIEDKNLVQTASKGK